ncbi:MAG: FAD-dependent oxidoreductase [Myxococcales bacterium]|nr:FAD-dependent oxidoreductase [Myxococcales bacterium]
MVAAGHGRPSRVGDRVLVIGAGLAGLAAADRLLEAGLGVTVIDAFPVAGGRTASFDVPEKVAGLVAGDVVEHGLHAWFQHYHAVHGLMRRAGLAKPAFSGPGLSFWNPEQGHVTLSGGPGKWLKSALALPEAMRGDRRQALGALARLVAGLTSALGDPVLTDRQSAAQLLAGAGVPVGAIERVFRPCMYSLTSLPLEELSALEMLRWMSRILPDPRMRCVDGGTTRAMAAPIVESLRARGADVRFGVEVQKLSLDARGRAQLSLAPAPDRTGLRHILVPGFAPGEPPEPGGFDAVICTLPWERLLALGDTGLWRFAPELKSSLDALDNVHPLSVRLWFERPIAGASDAYLLSAGTVFDVLRPTPEPARYGDIHLVDLLVEDIERHLPELGYDHERIVEPGDPTGRVLSRVLEDLERIFPGQIRDNPVQRSFLHTREGIIACRPRRWSMRPAADIGSRHFYLAGDYTRQPYGVCMEGAARSGQIAVDALLGRPSAALSPPAFGQLAYSLRSLFERV